MIHMLDLGTNLSREMSLKNDKWQISDTLELGKYCC